MSGSNWTFVVTDDQRQRVVQALTDKAVRIEQAANQSGGNAHRLALTEAAKHTEIAALFHPTSNTAEALVGLPRDTWLLVVGWLYSVAPDGDFPWFLANLMAAIDTAVSIGEPGR